MLERRVTRRPSRYGFGPRPDEDFMAYTNRLLAESRAATAAQRRDRLPVWIERSQPEEHGE